MSRTIMLVAAEASGDALGAGLMRALRQIDPGTRFIGTGGQQMQAEGLDSLFDISDLGILGPVEGFLAWRRVVRRAQQTAVFAAAQRPDAVVLIDSWGFTLRVAQRIRRIDPRIPLIKYVGPQVWASRPGRAKTLAQTVDHLLSIHAFDVQHFEAAGLATTFVGNPVLARNFDRADGAAFRARHGIGPDQPVLLLLPGSRRAEISSVYPHIAETAHRLMAARPDLKVVVPVSPTIADQLCPLLAHWAKPPIIVGPEEKDDAFVCGDVALACSGTVTTELAIAGCPVVIAYRFASQLSFWMVRAIALIDKAAMMNIAAGRYVAPEFIQNDCTADLMTPVVAHLLDDAAARHDQRQAQYAALALMGRNPELGDPSARAGQALVQILDQAL